MSLYLGQNKINKLYVDVPISLQSKTVSPSQSIQIIGADSGYNGLSQVTIDAAALQVKTASPSTTSQSIVADEGYYGLQQVNIAALQDKNITPTVSSQLLNADSGYFGLSSVTINATPLTTKTITTNGTYIASADNVLGYSSVVVNTPVGIKQLINNDTSITPTGTYATATYYNKTYGVKIGYTSDGDIILSMKAGTTSGYETLYFYASSLPSGATLTEVHTTSTSYVGGSPELIYACVISGLSQSYTHTLSLAMNTINATYDYTRVDITIS